MSIEILNESGAEVDGAALVRLAAFVLERLAVNPLAELSVMLVDTGHMERLHVQYLDEPGPTDVLAFPQDDLDVSRGPSDDRDAPMPALLGDVVLCPEVAAAQARTAGHSTEAELHLLCTHGILHLLGFDHGTPEEEREMFGLQQELLDAWRSARGGARR